MNAIAALLTRKSKGERIRDLEKEVRYLHSLLSHRDQQRPVEYADFSHRITLLEEDVENLKEPE